MGDCDLKEITLDGTKYVRADSVTEKACRPLPLHHRLRSSRS